MMPKPPNGVPIEWDALPPDPPPSCPRCGETRMLDVDGYTLYCNVCGKTFTRPKGSR
jgi:hypothetical protein